MAVKPSSKVEAQRALRVQRAAQSTDPAAPARSRAVAIRAGLESFVATRRLIAAAFQDQDWIALGYTSWEAYCDTEFSLKSMRLTTEERNEAILAFASVGMTTREIGAATGTSKDTASRALRAAPVSRETKSPLVEALRDEIEAAAERTEAATDTAANVGAGVSYTPPKADAVLCPVPRDLDNCAICGDLLKERNAGYLRCPSCDPRQEHIAEATLDGQWAECRLCAAARAVASEISGSGDGASPVAGSGPETAAEGADTTEADGAQDVGASSGRSLSRPATAPAPDGGAASSPSGVNPEERTGEPKLIGCPLCVYRVEVSPADPDVSVDEMYGHLTRSHDLGELEAEEALAKVGLTYSPAADEMPHIPAAGASPTLAPQQPGQDSPTGQGRVSQEGRAAEAPDRSETDHHRAGVSGGEARVASQERATAEPVELEDGGVLPPESPSSSDPAVLLRLFAEFLYALDRTDIDVIAPLLLTEEMQQLHEAADRVATFVGLLETWRTP